jgi:alpha-L-rhamnosidase
MNHHFWGDISAWFIKCITGIQLNPNKNDANEIMIAPSFVTALDHASAYHITPLGKISVSWKREGENIILDVEIPQGISATSEIEPHFCFEDGERSKIVVTGTYKIIRRQR